MKNSNDASGNRNRYLPAGRAMPQPTLPPRTAEKTSITFSSKFYLFSDYNLPQFCNETQTVMIATARRRSSRKLHIGTDCLQQMRLLEVIRPFVFLLRHGYCLIKYIKSIRELVMCRNEKWNTRSFI